MIAEVFNPHTIVESHEQIIDAQYILGEISQARDNLTRQWQGNGRQIRSFEPEFDRVCYVALGRFKNSAPEAYLEAKQQLDSYTEKNLTTTVGERLNTTLSQWNYEVREDGIYAEGTNEKAIEMYKRGRDFRRKHGKEVDFAREDAELAGFGSIDNDISKNTDDIPDGTMWISISPPGNVAKGSIYNHKFYDILTFKKGEKRNSFEARRYASALSEEESFRKISPFDPENYSDISNANAEYFLSHPVKIAPNDFIKNADDLHKYLHKNVKDTLSSDQFEYVLQRINPAIQDYIHGLTTNPQDVEQQLSKLRGVLNAADATADMLNGKSGGSAMPPTEMMPLSEYELAGYQQGAVKEKQVGCGFSGDYGGGIFAPANATSAFSVAEFGSRPEDDPNLCRCGGDKAHFHCPGKIEGKDCDNKIIVGNGTSTCPSCGEGKRC